MDDPQDKHLGERIERLELTVGEVQLTISQLDTAVAGIRALLQPSAAPGVVSHAQSRGRAHDRKLSLTVAVNHAIPWVMWRRHR